MSKAQNSFYNERNKRLILDVCGGMTIKDVAAAAGISRSRVDQILSKAIRILRGQFMLMNKVFGELENYYLLGTECGYFGLNNTQHFQVHGWMHELLVNGYYSNMSDTNLKNAYDIFKAKQEAELGQVTQQWFDITREVLWGKSIEVVAEELQVKPYNVAKAVQHTCYKINPNYIADHCYSDDDYGIKYYRSHKRIFFDPIEINFPNLRYAPLLGYLEDGEVPQPLSPAYLQMLFERKNANVGIIFSVEHHRLFGSVEFHGNRERHLYGDGELIVVFDKGPQEVAEYREDLMYLYVAVCRDDFKYFNDFNNFGWVDLMLNLMIYLPTPRAEEQLKQAA